MMVTQKRIFILKYLDAILEYSCLKTEKRLASQLTFTKVSLLFLFHGEEWAQMMRALVYPHNVDVKGKVVTIITKFLLVICFQREMDPGSDTCYKFLVFHLPYVVKGLFQLLNLNSKYHVSSLAQQ